MSEEPKFVTDLEMEWAEMARKHGAHMEEVAFGYGDIALLTRLLKRSNTALRGIMLDEAPAGIEAQTMLLWGLNCAAMLLGLISESTKLDASIDRDLYVRGLYMTALTTFDNMVRVQARKDGFPL